MSSTVEKIKAQVLAAGKRMLDMNMVAGTWGNISCRVPGEALLVITPSGLPYEKMQPGDLVAVDLDGGIVEGGRKPSSETPLHLAVYRARSDVGAVVHTHSIFACAMAVAGVKLPPVLEDLAMVVGGEVCVADYAPPGTTLLAKNAVKALGKRGAVFLANHGLIGVGRTLDEALNTCQVVERSAQVYILAGQLGKQKVLQPGEVDAMRKTYLNVYRKG